MSKATIENPKVFISYAWGDQSNQQRVISFAKSLMDCGIDVLLDRWNLKEGNDKYAYMEKCVTDKTVTNVLLLLDKNYTEKANARTGGVGDETQIISAEIYGKADQKKFMPVIFSKGDDGRIYKPAYLQSALHIDLSDSDTYDENFQYLVKLLYGVDIHKKPELGTKPSFVEEESVIPIKTKIKFEKIKNQSNCLIQRQELKEALNSVCNEVIAYDTNIKSSGDKFYKEYIERCMGLIPLRDRYLELLKISLYVDEGECIIAAFLEETYNRLCLSTKEFYEVPLLWLHELFIYTIAFYVKYEFYNKAGYILGKSYLTTIDNSISSYQIFYCSELHNLDTAMRQKDNKRYITGVGSFWIQNIKIDFCSQEEFVLGDILCYNYTQFSPKQNIPLKWFPITYIYGQTNFKSILSYWSTKLKTKEFVNKILHFFNFKTLEEFVKCFVDVEKHFNNGEYLGYGYSESFYNAPLICNYLQSSDIGQYR